MIRNASVRSVSARCGSGRLSRRAFAAVAFALCLAAALGVSACSAPGVQDAASDGAQLGVAQEGAAAPDVNMSVIYANGVYDGAGSAIASGDEVSVSDFRGKVVIMTYWATWCGYCVRDMPVWDSLAEKYAGDLVVVAVNRGDDRGSALQYAQDSGYDFVWSIENAETRAAYPSSGIPYTVIIDREGTVRYIADGSRRDMEGFITPIIEPLL